MMHGTQSIFEGIGIAFRALLANKSRALLTTLGIIIGVVTVTLMMMIIQGLNKSFAQQLSILGSGTVYVERYPWIIMDDWWKYRNRPRLTREHFEAIQKYSRLADAVSAYTYTMRSITFRDKSAEGVGIIGVTPQFTITGGFMPEFGRFISDGDMTASRKVCVIGRDIADKIFAPFNPIGRSLRVGKDNFKVVGILEKKGSTFGQSNDNYVLIPFSTLLQNYGSRRDVTISAKAKDPSQVEQLKDELTFIMRRERHLAPLEENNFTINEQSSLTDFYNRMTSGIYAAGLIIGGISLLVGGIGIMNIMLVSVTERTWEIGMRKAVGARTSYILWQFLVEAMIICMAGGTIGILLASLGGYFINKSLPATMSPWLAVSAVLFSAVVGLVFGLFPAVRAARLDPISALRQE